RPDLGLTEVGIDDTDPEAAAEQSIGEKRREGRLARVDTAQEQREPRPGRAIEDALPAGLDHHHASERTAASIRARPFLMVSRPVAYERRMWSSDPKFTPATVAIRASSSRNPQTSAEPFRMPLFARLP